MGGLYRNGSLRNGNFFDGFHSDYLGGNAKLMKSSAHKSTSSRLVTALTCLQLGFAMYATLLLFYVSPAVDLRAKPDFSRATRIAQQWKQLVIPHTVSHQQEISNNPLVIVEPQPINISDVCEHETIDFEQKKSNNAKMIKLKRELYDEILDFQGKNAGTETLSELLEMKSQWDLKGPNRPKVTVLLNHFKRKTLCSQLDSLLQQTLPFHHVWVLAFGSPNEQSLKRIVNSYNDTRISFISSTYDFKYFGRFQMALQSVGDLVYILDDDMIPGKRMLEILSHAAGTDKYQNSVLGSIGRILPFRQKDFTFPSYRKFGVKEAGLYLPDPAYDILVEKVVQVDFLSSSWFLPSELVKTLFIEDPFTFTTGEDLHLSYLLQKYRNAGTFVLPVDPKDKETWGDSEHRLAYVSETTVIFKDIVQVRDEQWWATLTSGYITQWAAMNPQKIDALFYAHSVDEVKALAPLLKKFRSTAGKKAYIAVSGGHYCLCEDAAAALKWPKSVCKERRFKIFDLGIGTLSRISKSEVPLVQAVFASMRGLIKMHNPSVVIAVNDSDSHVKKAIKMAADSSANASALVLLPSVSVPKVLWMADLRSTALPRTASSKTFIYSKMGEASSSFQLSVVSALFLSVASSVSIVVCNKALMSNLGFPFATTLTSWHLIVTFGALHLAQRLNFFETKSVEMKMVILFGLLNGVSIGLLNLSLGFNSIGFYQMTKLAIIPFTVLLETLFLGKQFSRKIKLSLFILLLGVGIASVTDLQLNFLGSILSILAIITTCVGQILTNTMQKRLNVSSTQLLYQSAPFQAAVLFVSGPLLDQCLTHQNVFAFKYSAIVTGVIILSCILSVSVNFSTFLVIGKTSPVTYQVLGHLKTCLVLAFGYTLLHDPFTHRNIIGITIAVFGMALYSYFCTHDSKRRQLALDLSSQGREKESSPVLPGKNTSHQDKENHDIKKSAKDSVV